MTDLETKRLLLRKLELHDADFIIELLNDPDFIRNIADRGIKGQDEAEQYLTNGPLKSYRDHGFGMLMVEDRAATPLGLCGLIKRSGLDDIDIGFAFLPQARGKGFALEAARAVFECARDKMKLKRLVAITNLNNQPSIQLLEKLGMKFERKVTLPHETVEILLYAKNFG